jgi:quercetin dioxygenase-like cupin family protein
MLGEVRTDVAGQAPAAAGEPPSLVGRDELSWAPAPDGFPPGVHLCVLHGDPAADGVFTLRLKVSDGVVLAPHRHPFDEHLTVVSGALLLGYGATLDPEASRLLAPGGYAFLPREQLHFAWADGETVFQVSAVGPFGISYENPADDPRNAAPVTH